LLPYAKSIGLKSVPAPSEFFLHSKWSTTLEKCSPATALDDQLGKMHDFAEAFPALEKLPDDYQNKRLASLSTELDEATQKSKEEIEVFGAKISSELIPLFGLPILAIFLFQFSAVAFYVASNVERIEVEEASQWSFMLRGWPFLILSAGTIFGLPAAAATLSFIRVQGETILPRPINFLFAVLVVIYAFGALFSLWILRSRVLRNPSMHKKQRDLESR
jgi:hypothetical protein